MAPPFNQPVPSIAADRAFACDSPIRKPAKGPDEVARRGWSVVRMKDDLESRASRLIRP
jgi:hypothetical protein